VIRRHLLPAVAAGLLLVLLTGCGSSASGGQPSSGGGSVTVFAASSLTNAFGDIGKAYKTDGSGNATFSFAGSQVLVQQIQDGAPADVIATADVTTMRQVADQLVSPAKTFARNTLVIVTAASNPKHIKTFADLADPNLQVVLADPSVPAGKYAAQALSDAHVTVHPRSLEVDVRSVLTKVQIGEADAGIVYLTDAKTAGSKVASIPVPNSPVASYQIGALDKRGEAFVHDVLSSAGESVLHSYGFLPP
jgi:molybdate transport system substrate-binding protein